MAASSDGVDWAPIDEFSSLGEFRRFQAFVAAHLADGALTEVPVADPYAGATSFDEHWYRTSDGDVWRLVAPDPPFHGLFERVS